MNDKQFEQLAGLISTKQGSNKELLDAIFKIIVSLISLSIIWIASTILDNKNRINKLETVQTFNSDDARELKLAFSNFTEKPRFSYDDFQASIKPIEQKVNRHNLQLSTRQSWMEDTSSRVTRLENKYDNIEKDLETIQADIKSISNHLKNNFNN